MKLTPRSRAALSGAARLLARLRPAAPAGPDSASALDAVRTVQRLLAEHDGAEFHEAVREQLLARGFPPLPPCERCGVAPRSREADPLDDLVDVLGPLGVRGAVRSAVELYGTYGDPSDVLSSTQVDQLCAAAEHFDTE
ncbi:hypothetical protein ACGRHY_28915 [Streptomyces sp. HK10]|uniref:hypothetical protein n=1 Tax=Streptomyces sp. HK10 TaxID=3373255 RepID=UPI0037479D05